MFGLRALDFRTSKTMGQAERSGACQGTVAHGLASGMVAGTKVATEMGWRPVEGILPGDRVLTFDGGLQEVVSVQRGHLWSSATTCPRHMWPLRVAPGTIGNTEVAFLLPEQPVMIESDCAEALLGDPFALIPAAALQGYAGVEPMAPPHDLNVVILHFATEQVVFANMGALFLCPAAQHPIDLMRILSEDDMSPYVPLPLDQAALLLAVIEADTGPDNTFFTLPDTPGHAACSAVAPP